MNRKVINQKTLDKQMQKGYELLEANNRKEAVITWLKLWENFKRVMEKNNIDTVEEMDEIFEGTQTIFNWSSDFAEALTNLSRHNEKYLKDRIAYSEEYLKRKKDTSELNSLNMKSDMGQAYYEIGEPDKGEKVFKEITSDYPKWGWEWIYWSDGYGYFAEEGKKDYERALQILNQALEVNDLEDREDVLERIDMTEYVMNR